MISIPCCIQGQQLLVFISNKRISNRCWNIYSWYALLIDWPLQCPLSYLQQNQDSSSSHTAQYYWHNVVDNCYPYNIVLHLCVAVNQSINPPENSSYIISTVWAELVREVQGSSYTGIKVPAESEDRWIDISEGICSLHNVTWVLAGHVVPSSQEIIPIQSLTETYLLLCDATGHRLMNLIINLPSLCYVLCEVLELDNESCPFLKMGQTTQKVKKILYQSTGLNKIMLV